MCRCNQTDASNALRENSAEHRRCVICFSNNRPDTPCALGTQRYSNLMSNAVTKFYGGWFKSEAAAAIAVTKRNSDPHLGPAPYSMTVVPVGGKWRIAVS